MELSKTIRPKTQLSDEGALFGVDGMGEESQGDDPEKSASASLSKRNQEGEHDA